MSRERPGFFDSPFFIPDQGNWHLADNAPGEVREAFEAYMEEAEQQYNKYLYSGIIEAPFYPQDILKSMTDETARKQKQLLSLVDRSCLDDALLIYSERFNENFPTMAFHSNSESEIKDMIKDCLKKNKLMVIQVPADCDV